MKKDGALFLSFSIQAYLVSTLRGSNECRFSARGNCGEMLAIGTRWWSKLQDRTLFDKKNWKGFSKLSFEELAFDGDRRHVETGDMKNFQQVLFRKFL